MKVRDFAPQLAGRMLPGLFSCDLKIGQRERFPGDPWPHFPPSPQIYWMHSTGCDAGLYRAMPARRDPWPCTADWISMPPPPAAAPASPAPQAELFAGGMA